MQSFWQLISYTMILLANQIQYEELIMCLPFLMLLIQS